MSAPTTSPIRPDTDDRLREAILYVALFSRGDPRFSATKLNKLLWVADFLAYRDTGKSITGSRYMRLGNGPVPRRLVPVRDSMLANNECHVDKVPMGPGFKDKERLVPLRNPDMSSFSGDEVQRLQAAIDRFWGWSGTRMSKWSHRFLCWQVVGDRDEIPYETIFVSDREPSEAEFEFAKQVVEDLKAS